MDLVGLFRFIYYRSSCFINKADLKKDEEEINFQSKNVTVYLRKYTNILTVKFPNYIFQQSLSDLQEINIKDNKIQLSFKDINLVLYAKEYINQPPIIKHILSNSTYKKVSFQADAGHIKLKKLYFTIEKGEYGDDNNYYLKIHDIRHDYVLEYRENFLESTSSLRCQKKSFQIFYHSDNPRITFHSWEEE